MLILMSKPSNMQNNLKQVVKNLASKIRNIFFFFKIQKMNFGYTKNELWAYQSDNCVQEDIQDAQLPRITSSV